MATAVSERVAIVTGAGRGIGEAVARRLVEEGLSVGLLDLDVDAANEVARSLPEGRAHAVCADVADETSVNNAVGIVTEQLGPPAVLVNNAGVLRDNLIHRMSVDDWDMVSGVHLRGAFLCTRAVQKYMVEARWGRIVNMSSASAQGNRGQLNYSAAKAGLQGFTKTLAHELGPFGVTANAVAPGYIATEMTAATAERAGMSFDDFKSAVAKDTSVGRVGTPHDVAHAVAYFCSEDASFVTGQVLYVAGKPLD